MTLHKLLAVAACALLLLTACKDLNDERIANYKKCQAGGMDAREYIDGYGQYRVRCAIPGAQP